MDDLFARAAAKTYVTCDELVDPSTFGPATAARFVFWERAQTTGVVHMPCGARALRAAVRLRRRPLQEYAASAKDGGGWAKYFQRYVACTEAEYLERVGGEAAVRLPLPVF